jgi:hypothetical protein
LELRAVTSLYDIGRATKGDGRTIDDYVRWLNGTLRLPVPFTIYLDPGIDPARIALKPDDEIVVVPFEELETSTWLPQVEAICRDRAKFPSSNDLNYRLPRYGILMMSKFDMIERTANGHRPDHLLWVDAGASRFTPFDLRKLRVRTHTVERFMAQADLAVSARHHLRDYAHGRPPPVFPGRCQTLTNGTAFMVRASSATRVKTALYGHVERDWLANQVWDTEQTAMGEIILARSVSAVIQQETFNWISVLGGVFEPTVPLPVAQKWNEGEGSWRRPLAKRLLDLGRDGLIKAWRTRLHGRSPAEFVELFSQRP